MSPSDRHIKERLAFEALMHADADLAASDPTNQDARINDEADAKLSAMIDQKLAEIGERRLAAARAARQSERPIAIRPALLAMVGAELRAYLRRLEETMFGGRLVAAHRNLDEISDDAVRSLITDLEALGPDPGSDEGR